MSGESCVSNSSSIHRIQERFYGNTFWEITQQMLCFQAVFTSIYARWGRTCRFTDNTNSAFLCPFKHSFTIKQHTVETPNSTIIHWIHQIPQNNESATSSTLPCYLTNITITLSSASVLLLSPTRHPQSTSDKSTPPKSLTEAQAVNMSTHKHTTSQPKDHASIPTLAWYCCSSYTMKWHPLVSSFTSVFPLHLFLPHLRDGRGMIY